MMTNRTNRVLYTGVTGDLKRRVYQHRQHLIRGFTDRYNAVRLVYYE
jgi:putative endonuclease